MTITLVAPVKKKSIMSLQAILDNCGLNITSYQPVHGGDINQAYCLLAGDKKYFLKVNDARLYPDMFEKESKGLKVLSEVLKQSDVIDILLVPGVVDNGVIGGQQYLLLEWINAGRPGKQFWENFGMALAAMHRQSQAFFGWEEDNYIGSLEQKNSRHEQWVSFYTACRILPLVRILFDSGAFTKQDIRDAENFCRQCDGLFPDEPASLLHGDLWSGNFMIAANGNAAIYDPAVYYGHREMDIGMTMLFGGFNESFYSAYHAYYPLEKGWKQRLPLTQLYPLLVHAVLFGGHYIGSARSILRKV